MSNECRDCGRELPEDKKDDMFCAECLEGDVKKLQKDIKEGTLARIAILKFCKHNCSKGMFDPSKCQFPDCSLYPYKP